MPVKKVSYHSLRVLLLLDRFACVVTTSTLQLRTAQYTILSRTEQFTEARNA